MKRLPLVVLGIIAWAALAACSGLVAQAPPPEWDGLRHRETSSSGALYVREDVPPRSYRRLILEPLVVSIDEHRHTNRNIVTGALAAGPRPVSSREVRHIEDVLGPQFRAIFATELAAAGYTLVDRQDESTLRVRVALVNLQLELSEFGGPSRLEPNALTLVMDVSDAASGQSLRRLVDTQQRRFDTLEFPNSLNNNLDYRRAVQAWARRLHVVLDEMNHAAATQATAS